MAQFDVHLNPNEATRESVPLLLDVQCDLLSELSTRVVIPLMNPAEFGRPAEQLNPRVTVNGQTVVLSTAELAGVPVRAIGEPIGSLVDQRDDIIRALDFLLTGV